MDINKFNKSPISFDLEEQLKQPQKVAVVDIETYKWIKSEEYEDYRVGSTGRLVDPIKIKQKQEKIASEFALDPRTGCVIGYGILINTEVPIPLSNISLDSVVGAWNKIGSDCNFLLDYESTELNMLGRFWHILSVLHDEGFQIVSYKGKVFDFPFLIKRTIINGLDNTYGTLGYRQLTSKYDTRVHLDLYDIFEVGGKSEWAYLLGHSDTFKNPAWEIGYWWENGMINKIKEKNKNDLWETYLLWKDVSEWL